MLPPEEHALKVVRGLPVRPACRQVPGAGHFVFLAPCPAAMKAAAICSDPPQVGRAQAHAALNREMVAFFRTRLAAKP